MVASWLAVVVGKRELKSKLAWFDELGVRDKTEFKLTQAVWIKL
jgi:hypothetical protein